MAGGIGTGGDGGGGATAFDGIIKNIEKGNINIGSIGKTSINQKYVDTNALIATIAINIFSQNCSFLTQPQPNLNKMADNSINAARIIVRRCGNLINGLIN